MIVAHIYKNRMEARKKYIKKYVSRLKEILVDIKYKKFILRKIPRN